jgi:hypothetical protein
VAYGTAGNERELGWHTKLWREAYSQRNMGIKWFLEHEGGRHGIDGRVKQKEWNKEQNKGTTIVLALTHRPRLMNISGADYVC